VRAKKGKEILYEEESCRIRAGNKVRQRIQGMRTQLSIRNQTEIGFLVNFCAYPKAEIIRIIH
jgi:DNA-directed RNA polymerase subunit E'/Rpb7